MADGKDQNAGGAGEGGQNASKSIQVGDKEYTAEDIQSILAQQSEATQVLQQFAEVRKVAERYGLSPLDFVKHAEGSFGVVSELIDKKIIDEHGNLVQAGQSAAVDDDDPFKALLGGAVEPSPQQQQQQQSQVEDSKMKALLQAFQEIRGTSQQLAQEVEALKKDNAALLRYNLSVKLKQSFPDLEDSDIDLVIERARGDRTKSLADHAKSIVEKKTNLKKQAQMELAKQLGIENIDEHLNKLKQQKEGGVAALAEGKKIQLGLKPKSEDAITAREAAEAFLAAQLER